MDHIAELTGRERKAALFKAAGEALIAGDADTLERLFREHEQMFRTERPWGAWSAGLEPRDTPGDARAIIAREHFFEDWGRFAAFMKTVADAASPAARFERAVEMIVAGEAAALERLLRHHPDLVRARSSRSHHSTLLHYVGANGVENWRQRTPKNAVRIATILLDAGAEVDAAADMYRGGCTTLGLVATSIHPKVAGVLLPLIDVLLARGAQIDVRGAGGGANAGLMVNSCLANGRPEAAEYLAGRGAPLDLEAAAGVGRLDLVKSLLTAAPTTQMNDGFGWACEYGKTDVVEYLLDHGINVNELTRPHKQTGLHWAAHGGHVATVQVLLARGPALDVRDASWGGTPLGWALHGWWEMRNEPARQEPYYEVVALLVAAGAPVEEAFLSKDNAGADPRMLAALTRSI